MKLFDDWTMFLAELFSDFDYSVLMGILFAIDLFVFGGMIGSLVFLSFLFFTFLFVRLF